MDREWVEYENDEGAKVMAHRVTPDTEGEITLVGGAGHFARNGEVLVQSQNSNMYDVHQGRAFDDMYPLRTDGEEEERKYNPADYTAKEVRNYLLELDDDEEYDRVVEAERAGRNRASAIPKE